MRIPFRSRGQFAAWTAAGLALAAIPLAVAPTIAATVSTSSLTLLTNATTTVKVSSISGARLTCTASVPAPFVFTGCTTGVTSTTITITAAATAGTGWLDIKDASSTKRVTVTVKTPMTVSPSAQTINVGTTATFTISDPWSSNITLNGGSSYSGTYYSATRNNNVITVTGKAGTASAQSLKVYDGKTTITLLVSVTAAPAVVVPGRLLASNCFQCHATNAIGGMSSLKGKTASEIYVKLNEFKTKWINGDNSIMAAQAHGYTSDGSKTASDQMWVLSQYIDSVNG